MSDKKHTKYIKYLIVKIGAPFALAFWRVVGGKFMVSCTKYLIVNFETIIVCILCVFESSFITG